MDLELSSILIATGLSLTLVLIAVVAVLALRLRARTLEINALRADVEALYSSGVGMGMRVDALEERMRRHSDRMEQYEMSEPFKRSYKQAMQLIDHGANVVELVEQCGVTRGEAELLANLHRLTALGEGERRSAGL